MPSAMKLIITMEVTPGGKGHKGHLNFCLSQALERLWLQILTPALTTSGTWT